MVREVDEGMFDGLIKEGVVLVDFFATWCPPCKMMHPVIEELSQEYEGKAKVVQVDVDKNPRLAMRYSIMSVPTFIVFSDGTPIATVIGAVPKQELAKHLDKALNAK